VYTDVQQQAPCDGSLCDDVLTQPPEAHTRTHSSLAYTEWDRITFHFIAMVCPSLGICDPEHNLQITVWDSTAALARWALFCLFEANFELDIFYAIANAVLVHISKKLKQKMPEFV